MNFSTYQEAVFTFIREGTGHGVIDAVAGSGKTTTIVKALEFTPPESKCAFFAFNKHIVEALQPRVPSRVTVATLNSFGWGVCRSGLGRVQLDQWKTKNAVRWGWYKSANLPPNLFKECNLFTKPIMTLVSLLKAHAEETCDGWEDIAERFGVELPNNLNAFEIVLRFVWKKVIEDRAILDFDDQLFFPILYDLPMPKYDFVFVDEAQDLNKCQIEMVKRVGRRVIAVGDPYQAIYGFRGATPEAIENIIEELGAVRLPLSICYRCPKKVIDEAKMIVKHIEASPTAAEGEVNRVSLEEMRKGLLDGDFVLCRTTAPLVSECLKMIRAGKKAVVKGRAIGDDLQTLVNELCSQNQSMPLTEFDGKLDEYFSIRAARLKDREELLAQLEDRVETIRVLGEGGQVVGDIVKRISDVFKDDNSPGVTFCTAHRSKGLEAKRIWIMRLDLMPHPRAEKAWQRKQEMNLKYVAITRSLEKLFYVASE